MTDTLTSTSVDYEELKLSPEQEDVLSEEIFDTLTAEAKKEYIEQITSIEKDLTHERSLKIRVRPWIIKMLRKMANVHDIKAWAYRSDTVYLGHSADLFNPQLLQHEAIHVEQQAELSKIKLIWFIKWLIRTAKDMQNYKKTHGNSKYVKYESSTLTPMELEAYAHQADEWYLQTREPFAYKKYTTLKWEQEVFKKVGKRNDTEVRAQLEEQTKTTTEDWEQKKIIHDIKKLEQIIDETQNDERTMWVFNAIDHVNEITQVIPVLEKKLLLLQKDPELQTFSNDMDKEKYQEIYRNRVDEFNKQKETYDREINKHNIDYLLQDDFTNQEEIIKTIEKLKNDAINYQKEPTRFWLESKKSNTDNIEIEIPPK